MGNFSASDHFADSERRIPIPEDICSSAKPNDILRGLLVEAEELRYLPPMSKAVYEKCAAKFGCQRDRDRRLSLANFCFLLKAIFLVVAAVSITWTANKMLSLANKGNQDLMFHRDGPWPYHCDPMKSSRSLEFQFESLQNFRFLEEFDLNNETMAHEFATVKDQGLFGDIHVLPGPDDQKSDLVVSVSTNATNNFLVEQIRHEISNSSLALTLPNPWRRDRTGGCLGVNVSMYFRRNLTLKSLLISPFYSNVHILEDIGLFVSDTTGIDIKGGWLNARPFLASRKTQISVVAGSILGEYPLYDLLWITIQAGSVKVDVIPKPLDKGSPLPAELRVFANAGSIDIAFPPPNTIIPDRDYYTDIHTMQGSITGSYIHGRDTSLVTGSGRIVAKVLPFFNGKADSRNSTLLTVTDAGTQNIELLGPYQAGTPIKNLTSTHLTTLASLKVSYPREWEGFIDGKTTVGPLSLGGGSGLRIIESGFVGGTGFYIKAEKGEGDSSLMFRTSVGNADVHFD